MDSTNDIDFVVLWVDGSDKKWQEQFYKYAPKLKGDMRKCRFRDWDNLQFLFRGFEFCTPWVRKIHFVTWGHLPKWLNIDHEKLNIVRHEDFLFEKNLPVFNSHPIEINLHRIPGLADKFVYFNDDTFLLDRIKKDRFFRKDLPCDVLSFSAVVMSPIAHIKINNIQTINRHFKKKGVLLKQFHKIFSYKYRAEDLFKSLLLMPWPSITGFFDGHQPQPFLKSTFQKIWAEENDILEETSSSRLRKSSDVSQYLFRYWQLCEGRFSPTNFKRTFAKNIVYKVDAALACEHIISGKYDMYCLHDSLDEQEDFEETKRIINHAFEKVFPHKSSFEI